MTKNRSGGKTAMVGNAQWGSPNHCLDMPNGYLNSKIWQQSAHTSAHSTSKQSHTNYTFYPKYHGVKGKTSYKAGYKTLISQTVITTRRVK